MSRNTVLLLITAVLVVGGCTESPMRWKPTEPQKQAADLVVTDVVALERFTSPEGEPIRAEAERASKAAQTYFGLPKVRLESVAPANVPKLEQAESDAALPPPTGIQVVEQVIDTVEEKVQTGLGITESIIGLVGTIAGTYGFGRLGAKVNGWRKGKNKAEKVADVQFAALREVVVGVGRLIKGMPPEERTKAEEVLGDAQTRSTEAAVLAAKAAIKREADTP